MKQADHMSSFPGRLSGLPISYLRLSRGKRLLIVALSYLLGIAGLWFFFPLVHNGATMYLPIVSACWLFRYRGLLISVVLNGIAFQLTYVFLLRGILPDSAFLEGGVIGFGTSLLLGLVVCWLRVAVDLVHAARQQAFTAEQERLLASQGEHESTLAYEHQRRINELKDQFLMNVSHKLRTPLTVLGASLELFEEYHERLDAVKAAEVLTLARENHEELVKLVNQVLEAISVIGEIPVAQCEAVPVRYVVQEELGHLAPGDVQAYTIRLQVPELVVVWADSQLLRQVLRNLLSNIFKYVPKGTEILIEAEQTTPTSSVLLSVQDAGPGIPSEELPLLFERFVRLKRDLGGKKSGTGLGLYICKRLVEAMGGSIWVESSGYPGEGSRFCLTLPGAASPISG